MSVKPSRDFKVIKSYFALFRAQTSFTKFGGEFGNEQRPILEKIDMKQGRFNQQKVDEIKTCVICEWKLLFWRLELAYFREKEDLNFEELAAPMKKMSIPQQGPQNNLTKLYNYGHNIYQNGLYK